MQNIADALFFKNILEFALILNFQTEISQKGVLEISTVNLYTIIYTFFLLICLPFCFPYTLQERCIVYCVAIKVNCTGTSLNFLKI